MAISFISGTSTNGSASSFTFAHNIPTTSNAILFVDIGLRTTTSSGTGVTYSGVNMTRLADLNDSGANDRQEIWYLLNPPTGNNNVIVTLAASSKAAIGAVSYNGVNQTSPFGVSGTSNAANTAPTITFTTTTDNSWIFAAMSGRTPTTWTPAATQTNRVNDASTGAGASTNVMEIADDKTTTTAGSYTVSGTLGATVSYCYIAYEFKPFIANAKNQCSIF